MISSRYIHRKFTIAGIPVNMFRIVYAGGQTELRAAVELREYVQKTCGAALSVFRDTDVPAAPYEICVGRTNREERIPLDRGGLGDEGFLIEERGGSIFISGSGPRGTLYGVYEFLEKFVGWRFFTLDCEVLTLDSVEIPAGLRERQTPALEYRHVYWSDYGRAPLRARRKLNTDMSDPLDDTYGGSRNFTGDFAHSFTTILGLDNATEQPCLTDPATLEKTIAYVRKLARGNPGARYISVTQNDNRFICQCEACRRVYEEEGAPSGALVRFVNQVADAVRDEFPQLLIETFAYQWSRTPPQKAVPRDNVLIRFCTGQECRIHGYDNPGCIYNKDTIADIEKWGSISKNFFVWDYSGNFTFYLVPLANFYTLHTDTRFLFEKGATGLFNMGQFEYTASRRHEGSNAEFGALRGYLLSKVFWNPAMSDEEYSGHMNEFLAGYYGEGWPNIRRYIDFLVDCAGGHHCRIYEGPHGLYDTDRYAAALPRITAWFDEAKAKADCEQRDRLELLWLHVVFLKLYLTWDDCMARGGAAREDAIRENEWLWNELHERGIALSEQCRIVEKPDFTKSPRAWFLIPDWILTRSTYNVQ